MINQNKLLAFVIALKRFKRNSVILKKAKYKMAQQIGIHPNTFNSYLRHAIENGVVKEEFDRFRVIKLKIFLSDFNAYTGNRFYKHNILKKQDCKFKNVLREVEYALITDNVIENQEYVIRKKEEDLLIIEQLKRTDKKASPYMNRKDERRVRSKYGESINRVSNVKSKIKYNPQQITSCRHTGSLIGVSHKKANALLSSHPDYIREIVVEWVSGVSLELFDHLRSKYPKATIYPMISINKTKVSFGSTMVKRN